jgi:hypothetical protein
MFTSPSHPAAAPSERRPHELERSVMTKTDAAPRMLNLAEAAAFVRCSRAHLCNIIHRKVQGVRHLPSRQACPFRHQANETIRAPFRSRARSKSPIR